MNYGKRSSLPKKSRKICDMYDDGEDSKDHSKRKSRNASEKKRRDQFNILIQELCSMVSTKTRKLDKSAVLRATIHFLKAHNDMVMKSEKNAINENWKPSFLSDDEFSQLMLEALDGFLIVFSQQGHILYTSDSVISLLRHLPKDLESCTIYELIHEDDRPEMFKILSRADASCGTPDVLGQRFSFSCHMRRGTLEPDRPAEYEPVRFNGSFSLLKSTQAFTDTVTTPRYCFVATVRLLSTQLSREMATFAEKGNEFTSRHSLDWKFLFLDHRAPPIIGYLPFEVLGTSVYEYYHQDDLDKLGRCHEALMQTGEGKSCYYRFLTKGQEWIWLQTRFFITYNQWNSKPEFIVCTHQVVNYADVRTDLNRELELADSKMNGADSDSTNLLDSSASESASLSTSVSANSSINAGIFSTGSKQDSLRFFSTDDSISCSSSLKPASLSHSESESRVSGGKSAKSQGSTAVAHHPQPAPQQSFLPQSSAPFYPASSRPPEEVDSADSNLTPQQMTVIQLKLQEQLMMRHHKLQDAIVRQQQELQQVQQQLMMAQQLMMQHHPMLGQMFIQQQEQMMAGAPGAPGGATTTTTDLPLDPAGQAQGTSSTSALTPAAAPSAAPAPAPTAVQVQGMMATVPGAPAAPPGHQPPPPPQQQQQQQQQQQLSPQHHHHQQQQQQQQQPPEHSALLQHHEPLPMDQLVQHQSAARVPFAMHPSQHYTSTNTPLTQMDHSNPNRTSAVGQQPQHAHQHQQQHPQQQQQQQQHQQQLHHHHHPHHQHHPQQQQQQQAMSSSGGRHAPSHTPSHAPIMMPQPTMHSSMTLPPGAQAVPMQDLSCLGMPTLDMSSDQYMQPPDAQDPL